MDDIKIAFTKEELELLETLVLDCADSLDSSTLNTSNKRSIATECYLKIQKVLKTPCPLVSHCQSRTAPCFVMEPDDGCYYYRYFKDLIKRREGDKNE